MTFIFLSLTYFTLYDKVFLKWQETSFCSWPPPAGKKRHPLGSSLPWRGWARGAGSAWDHVRSSLRPWGWSPSCRSAEDRKDFPFQGAEVPVCSLEVLASHHIGLGGEPPRGTWACPLAADHRPLTGGATEGSRLPQLCKEKHPVGDSGCCSWCQRTGGKVELRWVWNMLLALHLEHLTQASWPHMPMQVPSRGLGQDLRAAETLGLCPRATASPLPPHSILLPPGGKRAGRQPGKSGGLGKGVLGGHSRARMSAEVKSKWLVMTG